MLILMLLSLIVPSQAQGPVVRLYVFTSPDCSHCKAVQEESLRNLAGRVGCIIESRRFNVDDVSGYTKLVELEEKFGRKDNLMPMVFVGGDVLGGEDAVKERLPSIIRKYKDAGGVGWPGEAQAKQQTSYAGAQAKAQPKPKVSPALPSVQKKSKNPQAVEATPPAEAKPAQTKKVSSPAKPALMPVYAAFFYQFGCKECERSYLLVRYLKSRHPNLTIREYDLTKSKNKILFEAMAQRFGIPQERRLLPSTLFIGGSVLQAGGITTDSAERIVERLSKTGSPVPWDVKPEENAVAERSIIERFRRMGPLTVASAGLLDGINPCAFTTLVFLISYLTYIGKKGWAILLVGGAFTAGVFLAYFGMGLGAFGFLGALSGLHGVARWVNVVVAAGAFLLSIVSFGDYLKAKRGELTEMTLQLPGILKKQIHSAVRRNMGGHMAAAFGAGVVVSMLEVACTGQVYLPTIIFVTSLPGMRKSGVLYLLLYNLMFILPLAAVFIAACRGTSSQALSGLSNKHVPLVKLLTSLLFLGLTVGLWVAMLG
jgi:hypothetical protein